MFDARGRPYFLWDDDMTADELRARLADPDPAVRAYFLGKVMRQAKPDDVFVFASLREIVEQFAALERYLGKSREFWAWLIERWGTSARGPG